ncbi:hypothetical protein [Pseudomonas saponiphila]|nr:hypothetical protein [Pseudomonas saponiphila]
MSRPTNRAVADTLQRLLSLPPAPKGGRKLALCEMGQNQAEGALDNPHHILRVLLEDIAEIISEDMLNHLSPVDLEQFCLQTALRDDSGSSMLIRLIGAFIEAYANEQTSDQATLLLREMEKLARTR